MSREFSIATERLILRELTEQDVPSLYEILSDPETMKYYPAPYDLKGTEGWVNYSRNSYAKNGFGLWAMTLKADGSFIGQCGLHYTNIDGEKVPEIGYHVNKKFWNKGYATEAALASLKYGFEKFHLPQIFIHTWVKNIPSQRIAEKVGMQKAKEYDKHIPAHNIFMRHIVYFMQNQDSSPLS